MNRNMQIRKTISSLNRSAAIICLLVLIATLFCYSTGTLAYTEVGGLISEDTTWSLDNSPYVIVSGVLVGSGVTLAIQPGVVVEFAAGMALQIDGTLIAEGTEADNIIFTANSSGPAPGEWGYIYFSDSSTDAVYDPADGTYSSGSILKYCVVEYAGGSGVSDNGAIRLNNAHPYIDSCIIRNNLAAGIYAWSLSGTLKIENCFIHDNDASYNGGGISTSGSAGTVIISNNIIKGNITSLSGGGIYTSSTTNVISNNIISFNRANSYGGGLYPRFGTSTIRDNFIHDNEATKYDGGGINTSSGTLQISSNIFSDNIAGRYGGGIRISSSTVTISHNSIIRNTASDHGCGISNNGTSTISDNVITANHAAGTEDASSTVYNERVATFNNNNIFENQTTYEFYNDISEGSPYTNCESNWWGAAAEVEIREKIYAWHDDPSLGIVDYTPWAMEMYTDVPVSPPTDNTATAGKNSITVDWPANPEGDVRGYILYWDTEPGPPYSNSVKLGEISSHTLTGLPQGTYCLALTASDIDYDNANDDPETIVNENQTEGNESWYSKELVVDILPILDVDPASHDFGPVAIDTSSPSEMFIVSNNGVADLEIGQINITGDNSDQFSLESDECSNSTLAQYEECVFYAAFRPSSEGPKSAYVEISSNDPYGPLTPLEGDGLCIEIFCRDDDEDGYGNPADCMVACTPPAGYVANGDDCDDDNTSIYPGADEICDGLDNDCDAVTVDGSGESWYGTSCDGPDGDMCEEGTFECLGGSQNCTDNTGDIEEICNELDDDCDGETDEGLLITYYYDGDGDGYGDPLTTDQACISPPGYVSNSLDCDDSSPAIYPDAIEICDGLDNDCDAGTVDGSGESWYGTSCDGPDSDMCEEGIFECLGGSQNCTDNTGDNEEICNELDDDCDGYTDNNIISRSPVADAGGPYVSNVGEDLALDGSGSSDPDSGCGDSIVSYEWDLDDDGQFDDAAGPNPTIPWATLDNLGLSNPSSYQIGLRVTDTFGLTDTATATLTIYLNEPSSCFTTGPNPAACGESISFDGSCSSHDRPDRNIVIYEWDFDYDGSFTPEAAGMTTSHAYPAFGTYTAALRVTDDNEPPRTDIETVIIDVSLGNQAPVADAGGPYVSNVGEDLLLDGSGSSDPDSGCGDSIVSYEWDLDNDGQYDDAAGSNPTISWTTLDSLGLSTAGSYPIGLRVTDSYGLTNTGTATLTIYLNEPAACFTAGPNPAACGQTINFDGSCSSHDRPDRSIVTYEWDFDYDGSFSPDAAGETTTYSYSVFGAHTAALRVTDDNEPPRTSITTIDIDVTIDNQPPVADDGGPYLTVINHDLVLDASASSDPNEPCGDYIAAYQWDLDGDGFFDDASGMSVILPWEDIETLICGGTCSMGTEYTIGLKVSDVSGLEDTAAATFSMTWQLFSDDFAHGTRAGDSEWLETSGNWKTGRYRKSRQFYSVPTRNNRAVVQDVPDLDPISRGCFETRIELTDQYKTVANGSIIFCYEDNANYRYVRLVKQPGKKGKAIIGQVGAPGGTLEPSGVKAQKNISSRRLNINRKTQLRVDVYPDGLVNVFVKNMTDPVLSYPFSESCGGKVGYQAIKAKTYFDNFTVWDEIVLP